MGKQINQNLNYKPFKVKKKDLSILPPNRAYVLKNYNSSNYKTDIKIISL